MCTITPLSQHTSFLPHYLAQSDCLAADRNGQGKCGGGGHTRLTQTPSVIPNSNYVIMVSDWNCLKYFCMFLYCNHQLHKGFLITLYVCGVFMLDIPVILKQSASSTRTYVQCQYFYNFICRNVRNYSLKWCGVFYWHSDTMACSDRETEEKHAKNSTVVHVLRELLR
jgi:hypothetical protein